MPSVEVERYFVAPVDALWKAYTDRAGRSQWAGVSSSRLEAKLCQTETDAA